MPHYHTTLTPIQSDRPASAIDKPLPRQDYNVSIDPANGKGYQREVPTPSVGTDGIYYYGHRNGGTPREVLRP